jgi:hypothetical protein
MVMSLHSCGNLLHHGLRSLVMNQSVKAVAMVGCCYNLMTERLGQPTYKLPALRFQHPRLEQTSSTCDPHGFPMSNRLATYKHGEGVGVRLNITARMMAVQAPLNWTKSDSESFFTRHFYRALLQRLFVDRHMVRQLPVSEQVAGVSPAGGSGASEPVIIGSLSKACYESFPTYARAALEKLVDDPERGHRFRRCADEITDEELRAYEHRYRPRKHQLSVVWSLMAFSAAVVESAIVVDRWLYLKEQKQVKDCWVQTVFDYAKSPRNLVVVGIKK